MARCVLLWAAACAAAAAQTPAKRAEFDVASVRRAKVSEATGFAGGPGTPTPRNFNLCVPLALYVKFAYDVNGDQFNGPGWMDSELFTLRARVPEGATRQQLREMLQVLLERRFKLRFHREPNEVPAYRLLVAKGGHKLKPSAPASVDPNWQPPTPTPGADKLDREGFPVLPDQRGFKMVLAPGGARIRAFGQSPSRIAGMLTGQAGRPVIDATGLTGYYDYTLAFSTWASRGLPQSPEAAAGENDGPGASVFGAIQQQLGLRLEPSKTTVERFIVDWCEKIPADN